MNAVIVIDELVIISRLFLPLKVEAVLDKALSIFIIISVQDLKVGSFLFGVVTDQETMFATSSNVAFVLFNTCSTIY